MKDIAVSRLKLSDIKENEAKMFIDPDGEVIELKESWKELVLALITVLNTVKTKPLIEELCKNKIISSNLIITKGYVRQGTSNMDCYEILGTRYCLYCNLTDVEYINFIKKLCKAVKFDLKQCIVYLEDKKSTEQEREILSKKDRQSKQNKTCLEDINECNINRIKITGIEVGSEYFECKGIAGVIELLLMCNKSKIGEVEKELLKYSKDFEINASDTKVTFDSSFNRQELLDILIKVVKIIGFGADEISLIWKL